MLAAYFDENRRGTRPLWQVFWLQGVLVSQLLFAALLAVYRAAPAWTFLLATAGFLAYTAWIMREVWINAFNVRRQFHTDLARTLTVFWALNAVLVCGFLALSRVSGQPLPFF
jgi:hypothetical protein